MKSSVANRRIDTAKTIRGSRRRSGSGGLQDPKPRASTMPPPPPPPPWWWSWWWDGHMKAHAFIARAVRVLLDAFFVVVAGAVAFILMPCSRKAL